MKKKGELEQEKKEDIDHALWDVTSADAKVISSSMQKVTNIFRISGPLKLESSWIQHWDLNYHTDMQRNEGKEGKFYLMIEKCCYLIAIFNDMRIENILLSQGFFCLFACLWLLFVVCFVFIWLLLLVNIHNVIFIFGVNSNNRGTESEA